MDFTKEFEYIDEDNNTQKIKLRPLSIQHLGDLWELQTKLIPNKFSVQEKELYKKISDRKEGEELSDDEQMFLYEKEVEQRKKLTKDDIITLANLCEATLKKSKKGISQEDIDFILSYYFFDLYPLLFQLNMKR